MDPLQVSQASQARPTLKRKRQRPKVEEVPDLLSQWPSPDKVIFEPLIMKGRLSPQPILPSGVGIEPSELFSLFIPEDLYAIISKHTNLYANLHNAGENGRAWKPTIPGDIKTFCSYFLYGGMGGTAY
jgi:hypothetical protein